MNCCFPSSMDLNEDLGDVNGGNTDENRSEMHSHMMTSSILEDAESRRGESLGEMTGSGSQDTDTDRHSAMQNSTLTSEQGGTDEREQQHDSRKSSANQHDEYPSRERGPLSPFSPAVLKRRQTHSSNGLGGSESELSLSVCRKVSVIVRVEAPIKTDSEQKVCLFPLIKISRRKRSKRQSATDADMNGVDTASHEGAINADQNNQSDTGISDSRQLPEIEVEEYNPEEDIEPESSPSASFWKQRDDENDLGPRQDEEGEEISYSRYDIVVVNPTAFGKNIPSEITMERARLLSQIAQQSSTTDWIRSYRFQQVMWPPVKRTETSKTRGIQGWINLCQAMQEDLMMPGSISCRTVISVGDHNGNFSAASADYGHHRTNRKKKNFVGQTKAVFGSVVNASVSEVMAESSGASLSVPNDYTDAYILERYGLFGLTAHRILERNESRGRDKWRPITMSILEIGEDEGLYDLCQQKPYSSSNFVRLRYTDEAGSFPSFSSSKGRAQRNHGARLDGLSDNPIDSVETLGRRVRRAFAMAQHPKRPRPRGHVLAMLKVWDDRPESPGSIGGKCTVAQFLDVAVVQDELKYPERSSQREEIARWNASVRTSMTKLGGIMRGLLLKEAGHDTMISYRDCNLMKVLQRSLDRPDARVVMVANVSPMNHAYEDTMSTLRFVNSIMTRPGQPLQSPFGKNSNSKETSPTSASSDLSSHLSLSQFPEGEGFMRSLISDPRQRMAKLINRPSMKTRGALESSSVDEPPPGGYTPTSYMDIDPGEAAKKLDQRAEENRRKLENERARQARQAALPTPLVRNTSAGEGDDFGLFGGGDGNPYFEGDPTQSLDKSLIIDDMERGHDRYQAASFDEPSPLTADTAGLSFAKAAPATAGYFSREDPMEIARANLSLEGDWDPQSLDQKLTDLTAESFGVMEGGPDHSDRSFSKKMEDLSLELLTKTQEDLGSSDALLGHQDLDADRFLKQRELSDSVRSTSSRGEHVYQLQVELERLQGEVERRDHQIIGLQGVIETKKRDLKKAEEDRSQTLSIVRDEYENEIRAISEQHEKELRMYQEARKVQDDNHQRGETSSGETKALLDSYREEIIRLKAETRKLHEEKSVQAETLANLSAERDRQRQTLDIDRSTMPADHDKARIEYERELERVRRQLRSRDDEISKLREDRNNLSGLSTDDEESLRQQLQRALEEISRLKADVDMLQVTNEDQDRTIARMSDERAHEAKRSKMNEDRLRSLDDKLAEVISQKEKATREVDYLKERLGRESSQFQAEIANKSEAEKRLQSIVDSKTHENQSLLTKLEVASNDLTLAQAEAQSLAQQYETDSENHKRTVHRLEEELSIIQESAETNKLKSQDQEVEVSSLKLQRDKAERRAQRAEQDLETERENSQRMLQRRDADVRVLEEAVDKARKQLHHSHDDVVAELTLQFEKATEELRVLRQKNDLDVESFRKTKVGLETEVWQLKEKIESLSEHNKIILRRSEEDKKSLEDSFRRKEVDLRRQVEELQVMLKSRDAKVASMERLTEQLQVQLQESTASGASVMKIDRSHIASMERRLEDKDVELSQAQGDAQRQEERNRHLQARLEELGEKLSVIESALSIERKISEDRSKELEEAKSELASKNEEILALQKGFSTEMESLRHSSGGRVADLERKLGMVEEELRNVRQRSEAEVDRRNADISKLQNRIKELETAEHRWDNERTEVMKIAEEAIGTQAELEEKVTQLERQLEEQTQLQSATGDLEAAERERLQISQELNETKEELYHSKTELNDSQIKLAELQFTLRSLEKEREHLITRESESRREIARLEAQARKSAELEVEVEALRRENEKVTSDLTTFSNRADDEENLRAELSRKEEECLRFQDNIALLREQLASASQTAQDVANLENTLETLQNELQEADDNYREMERLWRDADDEKQLLHQELDQTRSDLRLRIADVKNLSESLKETLAEKEEAEAKCGNLKSALAKFQDDTRSRVEKFVHHRTETKHLLEKTLKENEKLVKQNQQLQSSLNDVQDGQLGPVVAQRDRAVSMLERERDENSKLEQLVMELQTALEENRDRREHSLVGGRERDANFGRASRGRDVVPGRPDGAEALLQRTLLDKSILLEENRRLQDSLLNAETNTRPDTRHRVSFAGNRQNSPWSRAGDENRSRSMPSGIDDDLAAHVALSAMKSVEKARAEADLLKDQLAAMKVQGRESSLSMGPIDALSRRISLLEDLANREVRPPVFSQPGTRAVSFPNEDLIDQLQRRVRRLEVLLQDTDYGGLR